jgi:hypothetical protein
MPVIKWWLTNYSKVASEPASEYITRTRLMQSRFIKSTNSSIILKLLSSSDLLRRNYI